MAAVFAVTPNGKGARMDRIPIKPGYKKDALPHGRNFCVTFAHLLAPKLVGTAMCVGVGGGWVNKGPGPTTSRYGWST